MSSHFMWRHKKYVLIKTTTTTKIKEKCPHEKPTTLFYFSADQTLSKVNFYFVNDNPLLKWMEEWTVSFLNNSYVQNQTNTKRNKYI